MTIQAMHTFPIARYHYVVDLAQGGLGHLELMNAEGNKVADLSVMANGQKLPLPRIAQDQSSAIAYVHESTMKQMLSILHTDASVVLRISGVAPGFLTLESDKQINQSKT
jgi:hypothetical protein